MLQPSLLRTAGTTPYQKRFQKNHENHAIINNAVDELLIYETKILSAVNHEAPEFLEKYYNENDLYQLENMIPE